MTITCAACASPEDYHEYNVYSNTTSMQRPIKPEVHGNHSLFLWPKYEDLDALTTMTLVLEAMARDELSFLP